MWYFFIKFVSGPKHSNTIHKCYEHKENFRVAFFNAFGKNFLSAVFFKILHGESAAK